MILEACAPINNGEQTVPDNGTKTEQRKKRYCAEQQTRAANEKWNTTREYQASAQEYLRPDNNLSVAQARQVVMLNCTMKKHADRGLLTAHFVNAGDVVPDGLFKEHRGA